MSVRIDITIDDGAMSYEAEAVVCTCSGDVTIARAEITNEDTGEKRVVAFYKLPEEIQIRFKDEALISASS